MKSKILKSMLLVAAAIVLVIASVFGTMAYLTSTSAVSNVFTVGEVKLQMFETKVKPDGTPVTVIPDGEMKNADTNSYHLIPGSTYTKDPTIYVDGSSVPSYLFVRVRNDIKALEYDDAHDDPNRPTIVEQMRELGWLEIERASTNVDAVFVYVGEPVAAGITLEDYVNGGKTVPSVGGSGHREDYDVFHEFSIRSGTDVSGMLPAYGGARVAIVAYAIQTVIEGYSDAADVGTAEAVRAAWDYIKAELPFVV